MGDYGGYGRILGEARELEEAERNRVEVACPRCGKMLAVDEKRGEVNCPLGHYRALVKGGGHGSQ